MAFQDFDEITQPRRTSNEQKFRRRIIIAAVSGVALLAVIGGSVFGLVHHIGKAHDGLATDSAAVDSDASAGKINKVVKYICNSTLYADRCESTLMQASSGSASPRELLVTAIKATKDELHTSFNKTSSFHFKNADEKAAFEDCEVLVEEAMDDLIRSIGSVNSGSSVSARASDLNSWLSAVITYQATCIDGFPEGELKNRMARLFKSSKELTSNSLALVTEVSSFLSAFQMMGLPAATPRHLLQVSPESSPAAAAAAAHTPAATPGVPSELEVDDYRFPEWMEADDRRMLKARDDKPTPNVTVAKDGSGEFKTINEALDAIPLKYVGRYVIYVKEGIYDEKVTITKKMVNVTMYGDGSQKSIITGNKNFADGVKTFHTATFTCMGEGFVGWSMGYRNTAGALKHQAVAARVQADRVIFVNCRFEGYQDTLYAHMYRQFYRSCVVAGTIDFIFGDAIAIFQNTLLVVRRPLDNQRNIITAQGRTDLKQGTGIVLHNCRIVADKALVPVKDQIESFLGRPWKEFSRTVVMESTIGDHIRPAGWLPWEGSFALDTLYYAEYRNKGPGAALDGRVDWKGYQKEISRDEAMQFTVEKFFKEDWVSAIKGVPVRYTLYDS